MKLKCTANAFFNGKVIKAGDVDTYEKSDAQALLSSGRFEEVIEDEKTSAKSSKKAAAGEG